MPEPADLAEVLAVWRAQPPEDAAVDLATYEPQRARATRELSAATRAEILSSVGAALFFAAVLAWRFGGEGERLVSLGCAGITIWAVVTMLRFRQQLRQPQAMGDLAATGVEHYLTELRRRRSHLRSVWVWHGPLLLASVLAGVGLWQRVVHARLWSAAPVVLLLVLWALYGAQRRWRYAAQLQREIDELDGIRKGNSQ